MPVYELSTTESRAIPGPVNKVECLVGQVVVVDPITKPATTTTLSTDESYDAEGHAGLTILDVDGSRVYVEYSLSPNAPANPDRQQVVVPTDTQPRNIDGTVPTPSPEDAPELHPAITGGTKEPRGDTDGDSPTGGTGEYEDRTVKELKATAKKNGVDLKGAKTKDKIIEKLRG